MMKRKGHDAVVLASVRMPFGIASRLTDLPLAFVLLNTAKSSIALNAPPLPDRRENSSETKLNRE